MLFFVESIGPKVQLLGKVAQSLLSVPLGFWKHVVLNVLDGALDLPFHFTGACKVKPRVYLFPTRRKTAGEERPITDKAVWLACHESTRLAGL